MRSKTTPFGMKFNPSRFFLALVLICTGIFGTSSLLPTNLQAANKETIFARVVGISDGDTVTVLAEGNKRIKVRLQGIDAPERSQAFGMKSRQNLANLIFGKNVQIKSHGLDKYKRTLGTIYIDDQDINEQMVKDGFAWFYRRYAKDLTTEQASRYEEVETEARDRERGLWADSNPTPPWDYRKKK